MPFASFQQALVKVLGFVIPLVGITAVLNIPLYLTGESPFNQQYQALFWALVASLTFLVKPARKNGKAGRWYDYLLVAITMVSASYIVISYYQIQATIGMATPLRMVMGILCVLALLESTRRVAGLPVVFIILFFIVYAKFGDMFPGLLMTKAMSWKRLFTFLYLNGDAWLGIPLRVALMIVFGFLFMGRVFFETGGGESIMQFAEAVTGRYRGGPAKVAVLASTFFGAISGSTVGNVASTGIITIPMMKRNGFRPEYAGAVEAVASNGGQILPPVMGAAAFIMAEFIGTGYPVIVLAAIVPGLLYYYTVFLQIHLRAVKLDLKPANENLPSLREVFKRGWPYAIPMIFLVYALFFLWMPPGVAALYAAGITVVVSLLTPQGRPGWNWQRITAIMEKTSRTVIEVTTVSAAAGLVVGVVSYTGLGMTFSRVLTELAGGNLFPLAVLTAIASICLGLGMPPGPAYILLAVLAAPALINTGVPDVSAHLFVFYFGILSMVTPPVCIAVYTASAIAEAPFFKCAMHSINLSVAAFLVPFVMIYNPALNFIGTTLEIIHAIVATVIGISFISIALSRFLSKGLSRVEVLAFAAAGLALMIQHPAAQTGGLVLGLAVWLLHWRANKKPAGRMGSAK
jgi:TRAP transporter 4TM/12TM fusion protein